MAGISLLIAEHDAEARDRLACYFQAQGYSVDATDAWAPTLDAVRTKPYAVIVSEIEIAQKNEFNLIGEIRARSPGSLTILLTGVGSLETAIEAVNCGAFDYVSRPFDLEDLGAVVSRAVTRWRAMSEHERAESPLLRPVPLTPKPLVGKSRGMREVYRSVAKATASNGNVLIVGETGTGKELVARAIHENGPRRAKRFLAINCAALTDTLLESELFGHVRGAFTGASYSKRGFFEEASGGTLFLDEVGDISPALQIKLLRVLQDQEVRPVGSSEFRPVDVRVIAATHRDLSQLVRSGQFREDLLYRLRVITIRIPSLRERKEDLEDLIHYFLFRYSQKEGKQVSYISDEAMRLLKAYSWPGNVRELEHAVEHAVSMTSTPVLFPDDFPPEISAFPDSPAALGPSGEEEGDGLRTLDEMECVYIVKVLNKVGYNVSRAAEILGIDRGTLYRKAERYHIPLRRRPQI